MKTEAVNVGSTLSQSFAHRDDIWREFPSGKSGRIELD